MKKQQVDHVLHAAGRITGERQFIIIGSQSLHGKYPDLADEILRSAEVDLIAGNDGKPTEWLNAIGYLSPFHETFGYYADPVDAAPQLSPVAGKGDSCTYRPAKRMESAGFVWSRTIWPLPSTRRGARRT